MYQNRVHLIGYLGKNPEHKSVSKRQSNDMIDRGRGWRLKVAQGPSSRRELGEAPGACEGVLGFGM
jgi:hypothetical protein